MQIEPFRIAVPEDVLVDLRTRLARTRFPDEIRGSGWRYGTDLAYLRELVAYWRDRYDWRAEEARLNQLHHFRARVGGLAIHFIHERGVGPRPLPLVVTHGWPGSVGSSRRSSRCSPTPAATAAIPPTPSTWWCRRCRATGSPSGRPPRGWIPSASPRSGPSSCRGSAMPASARRGATGARS